MLIAGLLAISSISAAQKNEPSISILSDHLTIDQIIKNLEKKNAQRSAALEQFEGKRIYRMQYRGFPSNRDAEMVVKVNFRAPNTKEFTIVSTSGSRFVIDRVFKKLLEGEQEAAKGGNPRESALTRENYDFELAGYEDTLQGGQYVINLLPKSRNRFLYRGKIWVDAGDFAVARIEAEPARNPSVWIKKTAVSHRYVKVDNFWLPAENHTESTIRMGGTAALSIEYRDYRILKAAPLGAAAGARQIAEIPLDNN